MRVEPDGIILVIAAVRTDDKDELECLAFERTQVEVHRVILAFVNLRPACISFDHAVVQIIEAEDYVAVRCVALAVDDGAEAVSRLHSD